VLAGQGVLLAIVMVVLASLAVVAGLHRALALLASALVFAAIGYATGDLERSFVYDVSALADIIPGPDALAAAFLLLVMVELAERTGRVDDFKASVLRLAASFPRHAPTLAAGMADLLTAPFRPFSRDPAPFLRLVPFGGKARTPARILGQALPPSATILLLADLLGRAHAKVLVEAGGGRIGLEARDAFAAAVTPSVFLAFLFVVGTALLHELPGLADGDEKRRPFPGWPFLAMCLAVPGAVMAGALSAPVAAALGAAGIFALAAPTGRSLIPISLAALMSALRGMAEYLSLIAGAAAAGLVVRSLGGERAVGETLGGLFAQPGLAVLYVGLATAALARIFDVAIALILVVPVTAPILLGLDLDPLVLGMALLLAAVAGALLPSFKAGLRLGRVSLLAALLASLVSVAVSARPQLSLWLPGFLAGREAAVSPLPWSRDQDEFVRPLEEAGPADDSQPQSSSPVPDEPEEEEDDDDGEAGQPQGYIPSSDEEGGQADGLGKFTIPPMDRKSMQK
jgi:TRAP-type mannitol/chloroaromatic compound transport system permease large subunit